MKEDILPTYLYIKKHKITGKLYFGKTKSIDPVKYTGSGIHWLRHIKKHGKTEVDTIWYKPFYIKEDLIEFAEFFSQEQNIVESSDWLNLKPENGLDGGSIKGRRYKQKNLSPLLGRKRKPFTEQHLKNMSNSLKGVNLGESNPSKREENRKKISESLKGKPVRRVECPHCNKIGGISNMKRYHFDKCKLKGDNNE